MHPALGGMASHLQSRRDNGIGAGAGGLQCMAGRAHFVLMQHSLSVQALGKATGEPGRGGEDAQLCREH